MKNFELAVSHVLKSEGGFVDHKLDKGSWTNHGISRKTLETYRGHTVLIEDVKELTVEEAKDIYRLFYWDSHNLEKIRSPVIATILFDQIVNRRASEVIRGVQSMLARSFGKAIEIDGIIGPKTIDILNSLRTEKLTIELVIEAQSAYLQIVKRTPSQIVFLNGWMARTWRLLELV